MVQESEGKEGEEMQEGHQALEAEHLTALAAQTAAAGQHLPRIHVSFLEDAQGKFRAFAAFPPALT